MSASSTRYDVRTMPGEVLEADVEAPEMSELIAFASSKLIVSCLITMSLLSYDL